MKKRPRKQQSDKVKATTLRIIGGSMGGQKIRYNGIRSTRPMRDSVRENLFNLLGPRIEGTTIIDPFGGTGILPAESFSRGARSAVIMDFDRRAIRQIQENLTHLKVLEKATIVAGDAFRGLGALLNETSQDNEWVLLLCPPYEMFNTRLDDLNRLIRFVAQVHSQGVVVAESDNHFDTDLLTAGEWDVRQYGITKLARAELSSILTE